MLIKDRYNIYKTSVFWGWWKVAALVFFAAGVYDLIEGQSDYNLPSIQNVFGWWDWKIWFIIALILLLISTCEGSYKQIKALKKQIASLNTVEDKNRIGELRKYFENRMLIPDKLRELFTLGKAIAQENTDDVISLSDERMENLANNLGQGGFLNDVEMFGGIVESKTFGEIKEVTDKLDPLIAFQAVNRMFIFINRGMQAENIGLSRFIKDNEQYQNLKNEIYLLSSPFPSITQNHITECVEIMEGINSLNLIDFSNLDVNPTIKIFMQSIDSAENLILSPILQVIETEIENFISVRQSNKEGS